MHILLSTAAKPAQDMTTAEAVAAKANARQAGQSADPTTDPETAGRVAPADDKAADSFLHVFEEHPAPPADQRGHRPR